MKKVYLIIFLLFLQVSFSYSQQTDSKSNEPLEDRKENVKRFTILHWNDLHARNMPYKVTKKNPDTSYFVGGISNVLGHINYFRNNPGFEGLVLNGGDDYQGSPISTITRGFSQIELLNLFPLDAFVLGNHEFDYGQFALDSALMRANFDHLSANVFFKPKNSTFGKPYIIKESNGIKAGIIGLTAPDLETLVLPQNISEIQMLNTDSVIIAGIGQLKKENCNLIILLTHIGTDNDKKLAEKFYKDVDVIVGGHSHSPLFEPVIQNGVIIVQAGSYARWIGKLELELDVSKDTVISFHGRLVETKMDSSIYDKAAQEIVEKMIEEIRPQLERVIGFLESDWKRSYTNESNVGQWQADAIRRKTGTDIAFMNAGGIRKDVPQGNVTVGDIWEINPFGNTIVTFNVSGKVLKQMIKNNLLNRVNEIKETGSSDMIVVSGLSIVYDSHKAFDGKEDFLSEIKVNGTGIDENRMYSISTNNYVGAQFVKYFGDVSEKITITDTNIIDRDLIIEAIEEAKNINAILETRVKDISNTY
jgi:2',3'-cyclic-nucleotide 2'-phosphodiesterase (5'-nucleotidase family)